MSERKKVRRGWNRERMKKGGESGSRHLGREMDKEGRECQTVTFDELLEAARGIAQGRESVAATKSMLRSGGEAHTKDSLVAPRPVL